jgi:AcrR family transcriptional regulator
MVEVDLDPVGHAILPNACLYTSTNCVLSFLVVSRPAPDTAPAGRAAPTRRVKVTGDVEEKIILAAARCFRRWGVDRTRMEDIAAEVGLHRPRLYRYFPTKESLIGAVIVRETRKIHEQRRARYPLRGPLAPLLVDVLVLGYRMCLEDEFVRFNMASDAVDLTTGVVASDPAIQDAEDEYWDEVLAYGRARGELRPDLSNRRIIRWFLLMQMAFLERTEAFDADTVRDWMRDFVVPAVLANPTLETP